MEKPQSDVVVIHIVHDSYKAFLCNEDNDHVMPLVPEHVRDFAAQGKRFVFTIRSPDGRALESTATAFLHTDDGALIAVTPQGDAQ